MSDETNLPDEESGESLDDSSSEQEEPRSGLRRRRKYRKKIKIRKRVKIKKKTTPKKKAKKMLETVAWVVIVAAFLVTIIMMILQLDLDSKHRQKKRSALPPDTGITGEIKFALNNSDIYKHIDKNSVKV